MLQISEYGKIKRQSKNEGEIDSFLAIFIDDINFETLKSFAQNNENILRYGWQKGQEVLQTQNFVGLIATKTGFQLEILPKILHSNEEKSSVLGTEILIKMLSALPNFPFKRLESSSLGTAKMPLWEIFINTFLQEIEMVIREGLLHQYHSVENNESYLKGKLQVSQQMKRNFLHQERFSVLLDSFLPDVPANRLLKSALILINQQKTIGLSNKKKIKELRAVFSEISISQNYQTDWQHIQQNQHLHKHYEKALTWAKIFLQQHSFTPFAGNEISFSLLFPMEQLFENYVALGFIKYATDYDVICQDNSTHLFQNKAFLLRPDLVLRKNNSCIVLDIKWKNLDLEKQNHGIDRADLYQLYAYGKKYQATKLVLIYPKNEGFTQSLELFYEDDLSLKIIPFDVLKNLNTEIEEILNISDFSEICN